MAARSTNRCLMMDSFQLNIHDVKNDIKTKRYKRDDLFKLAKSMPFDFSFHEELKRYETKRWPDERIQETNSRESEKVGKFHLMRSMSNLGRQYSELGQDYCSLNESNKIVYDSRRPLIALASNNTNISSNNKRQLARMTSSPSMKYNGSNQGDSISSQVWAKYNKLIEVSSETNRSLNNKQASDNNNSSWQTNERQIERPTRLFGPLRREPKPISRNSDEPLSLPYNLNQSINGSDDNRRSSLKNNPNQFVKEELSSSSPIKRISSSAIKQSLDDGGGIKGEDDDFDITSLLSITVLSDIKAIRHNEPNQASVYNRKTVSNYNHQTLAKGRQVTTEIPPLMRPITRAKTSTDFTSRDSRQGYAAKQQRIYYENNRYNDYRGNDFGSMSGINQQYNLNQQNNYYDNREMALSSQRYLSLQNTKPIDESKAQIIETFKAQIKARAKTEKSSQASERDLDNVSRRSLLIKSPPLEVERRETAPDVNKVCDGPQKVPVKEDDKVDLVEDKLGDTTLRKNVEDEDQDRSKQKVTSDVEEKDPKKEGLEQSKLPVEEVSISSHQTSNIPRLISLHKTISNLKIELDREGIEESVSASSLSPSSSSSNMKVFQSNKALGNKITAAATANILSSSSSPSAASTKFVSQYKLLRGKSLADEVEETSK